MFTESRLCHKKTNEVLLKLNFPSVFTQGGSLGLNTFIGRILSTIARNVYQTPFLFYYDFVITKTNILHFKM